MLYIFVILMVQTSSSPCCPKPGGTHNFRFNYQEPADFPQCRNEASSVKRVSDANRIQGAKTHVRAHTQTHTHTHTHILTLTDTQCW